MPPWLTRLVFRARPLSKALPICRCASTSSAPVHAPEQHDIVILGGGIVGLALASALSLFVLESADTFVTYISLFPGSKPVLRDTYNITLLDVANLDEAKSWQPISDAQFENRCSSITNQSRAFLQGSFPCARTELCLHEC